MPGFLLHTGATVSCLHQAPAATPPVNPRVLVGGFPAATTANIFAVTGCPFQIPVGAGTKPQPCVKLLWTMPASRVLVMGQPAILTTGIGPGVGQGQSVEQIPQGPPTVKQMQLRVSGL